MCVSDRRPLATTFKKTFPALLTLTIGTSRFKVAVLNITRCPENPFKAITWRLVWPLWSMYVRYFATDNISNILSNMELSIP